VNDTIKIGSSKNFKDRIISLRASIDGKVEPLLVIDGDLREERKHQAALKKHHLKGEWFSATEEVLQYIESMKHLSISEMLPPSSYTTLRIDATAMDVINKYADEIKGNNKYVEVSKSNVLMYMADEIQRLRSEAKELEGGSA
jgi:hypothetical protein